MYAIATVHPVISPLKGVIAIFICHTYNLICVWEESLGVSPWGLDPQSPSRNPFSRFIIDIFLLY